jgi:hypothetical protein
MKDVVRCDGSVRDLSLYSHHVLDRRCYRSPASKQSHLGARSILKTLPAEPVLRGPDERLHVQSKRTTSDASSPEQIPLLPTDIQI